MRGTLKKVFTAYAIWGFLLAAILPLLAVVVAFRIVDFYDMVVMYVAVPLLAGLLAGWFWAAKASLPDSLFARFMPLVLPPLLPLLLRIPAGQPLNLDFALGGILLLMGICWCCFYLAFLNRSERRRRSTAKRGGAIALLGVILACVGSAVTAHQVVMSKLLVQESDEATVWHGIIPKDYRPFRKDNLLERPARLPSLSIASKHPQLDGIGDAFPLYAAFAQAVYAGLDEESATGIVTCTNTAKYFPSRKLSAYQRLAGGDSKIIFGIVPKRKSAYQRLVDGDADIVFGVVPMQEELDYVVAKGRSLTETPIGKEALVFFVHKDNPVRSLTREQVRAIYSGRIRNWKDLGGPDEAILAFQRPEWSGCQPTMLRIMKGEAMIPPLLFQYDSAFFVEAYSNHKNALGYSFRWLATVPCANPDIRLLAIDGVDPTPENMRSGAYPFTVPLLAVTARPLSPESRSLLDWIRDTEGQDLLERVGYVPLR